ncbi:MAG TPA: Trm112 family protein [Terracidiphilus sp.]|nr:Trm112 family protein [Terracidiphilus sp.]
MPESRDNLKDWSAWAEALACPACLGALVREVASVKCAACGRVYPVVDGIPVLIAERGQDAAQE